MFETKYSKPNRLQQTIDYKTNEQSRIQNIKIEIYKQKQSRVSLVLAVFLSTCYLYYISIKLYQASSMELASKILLARFDFNNHLKIKQLSHVASCNTGKYFLRFSYFDVSLAREISCKIWKLGKYVPYCTRYRRTYDVKIYIDTSRTET